MMPNIKIFFQQTSTYTILFSKCYKERQKKSKKNGWVDRFLYQSPPVYVWNNSASQNKRRSAVVLPVSCLPSHMGEITCFNYCKHSQFFHKSLNFLKKMPHDCDQKTILNRAPVSATSNVRLRAVGYALNFNMHYHNFAFPAYHSQ